MTKQPDITFFVDRSIAPLTVPEALRAAGAKVEVHDSHFPSDTFDIDWLPAVSGYGWVVLTKDENIGRDPLEVKAIARAGAKVFILVSGNLTRQQMANLFVQTLPQLTRFTHGNQAPFIAKIYKNGRVKLWRNSTELLKRI